MTGFIPSRQAVEVRRASTVVVDRFGTEREVPGEWENTEVAGWAVTKTEEKQGESVLRTVDTLVVYCTPQADPGPGGQIRLPDSTAIWQVQGHAENYDHGPFGFTPGLRVLHARAVLG